MILPSYFLAFLSFAMLDFIYDSLDTVKKLKFPTTKQVVQLTLGIFALVIIAGLYFVLVDTLFSDGYRALYTAMTGKEITPIGVNSMMLDHTAETGESDIEFTVDPSSAEAVAATDTAAETPSASELTVEELPQSAAETPSTEENTPVAQA